MGPKRANVGFRVEDTTDAKRDLASAGVRGLDKVRGRVLIVNNREAHRRFVINSFETFADDNKRLEEVDMNDR
jgi:hypothetical protein